MLVAAPAFVLLGSIAISETLDRAARDLRTAEGEPKGAGGDGGGVGAGGSRGSDGGAAAKKKATKCVAGSCCLPCCSLARLA
jgi:hypothetical protein